MARPPLIDPPPAPAPQRADSQQIVAAVILAAIDLGPEATLADIAERAGVGTASLHRYFPTVGAIFAEVSRQMYRTLLVQVREILAAPAPELRTVVRKVCQVAFDGPNVSMEYRRKLNLDLPLSWSKGIAEAVYQEVLSEFTDWLARHLPDPPPDLSARVFVAFSYVRGCVLLSMLYPGLAPTTDFMVEQLLDTVMNTLTQRAAP